MDIFLVILSLVIIILTSIYWYQNWSQYAILLNSFPSVNPYYPVLGSITVFSRQRDRVFREIRAIVSSFDETFTAWAVTCGNLHIVTAEDAEIILSNPKYSDKGIPYYFLQPWMGTGLLTSGGSKWHQRRKMLTPAFHYNILKIFIEIFGEKSRELTAKLREECNKPKTDIKPLVTQATLETICETSLGIQLDLNNETQREYVKGVHEIADLIITRTLSPWIHTDLAYYFSPMYWKQRKLLKNLHKFTNEIIRKRFESFQDDDIANLESDEFSSKKRLALLDILIYENRHSGTIDNDGMREEIDTFVYEGHDTTTIAICVALLLFAKHPDVQKKIMAELNEIFGDSDRNATYDDLHNMKYLERCLKESLRLYPSVPLIVRKNYEDIPLTKHTIPANTEVFVHIYDVHRDPRYFPDPEKFDPDRFLPENSLGRHPFAYIPFSAGTRNCIGQKFAMLEVKSFVSSILRNLTLEPIDEPKNLPWLTDLVLKVQGPMHIKFKSRF